MSFTPPGTVTTNFDSLVTLTLNNTRKERYDNIFRKSVFWAWMHAQGRKELYDGGVKIQRSLEYATNGTVKSVEGYDPADLTPQETLTALTDDMREIVGSVVISRREEVQNKGRAQIANLLTSKIENLDRSFAEKMNEMLLAPTGSLLVAGNSGKDLNPLPVVIPLSANTLHNISGSTNTWWDNKRKTSASSNNTTLTLSNFKNELRSFYNTCSRHNGGRPDMVLTSQGVYEKYEQSLEGQVRYGQTELANLGFDTVMLYRAQVAWDQIVPRQTNNASTIVLHSTATSDDSHEHLAYFINSDYLRLLVESTSDMVNRPFMTSIDQLAKSALVIFMGQLVCTNRRTQGVLQGLDVASITG